MSTRPSSMRSLLFAPGNRPDVCAKLPRSRPDAAVLDLEDAVPPQLRVDARPLVRNEGAELARAHPEITWYVRVNAVASEWFAGDIADALGPELDGVVVPKVDTVDQITEVADALARAGLAHLHVLAGLETALGVADARTILDQPAVVAAYFGAEDYIADIGGVRTAGSAETLYARSRVALAARLGGALALDQVVTTLNDEDAYLADARAGRAMGFHGKLCIHPAQVSLARRVFSPSPDDVERARRLVTAYDDAIASGRASIAFEGQMIDEALVRHARSVLAAGEPEAH
ncbi:MAG: HpcH/HpaI aldolase/citrate lyase family protein [Acidimicrobiia bacterium]